jgi:hypothetical protein
VFLLFIDISDYRIRLLLLLLLLLCIVARFVVEVKQIWKYAIEKERLMCVCVCVLLSSGMWCHVVGRCSCTFQGNILSPSSGWIVSKMCNQQEADRKHWSVPPTRLHADTAQCVIFKICIKTVYIFPEYGLMGFTTPCSAVGRHWQLGGRRLPASSLSKCVGKEARSLM